MNKAKQKILIAEDNETLSDIYESMLKKEGYEVHVEANGADALEHIESFRPDLIVLDLNMPKMDGFEFLDHRKSNADLSAIPVIVLTGVGRDEDIQRVKDLGANWYFDKKTVELEPLLSKVQELLKK